MYSFLTNLLEPFTYLVNFIALLIYFRHTGQKSLIALLVYYGLSALLLTYGSLLVIFKKHNIWIYDSTALIAALFLGYYFHNMLQNVVKKAVVKAGTLLYVIYAIVRHLIYESPGMFDSIGYALLSALVVGYAFLYFHQALKNVDENDILVQFNFWLASACLIYFVGSFLIFLSYYHFTIKIMATYRQEERDILTVLWGIHNVLLFVSALVLLSGSLWITYRRKLA